MAGRRRRSRQAVRQWIDEIRDTPAGNLGISIDDATAAAQGRPPTHQSTQDTQKVSAHMADGHADLAAAALVRVAGVLEIQLGAVIQLAADALGEVHRGLQEAGNAYLSEWAGPAQGITAPMIEAGQRAMTMAAQLRERAARLAAGG